MHYSAKRGIVIACRPSVCLSVTSVDQDHIGWKSWKLIARTIWEKFGRKGSVGVSWDCPNF